MTVEKMVVLMVIEFVFIVCIPFLIHFLYDYYCDDDEIIVVWLGFIDGKKIKINNIDSWSVVKWLKVGEYVKGKKTLNVVNRPQDPIVLNMKEGPYELVVITPRRDSFLMKKIQDKFTVV